LTLRYLVGFQSDNEFALFDFDSYSEYYSWRRGMELRTIESLNLHSHPSEIEE
uniref:KTSC domain-containing protein n=1 Tax=Echinostoma caproni TaxID=27848 RepID=A0A183BGY2_9TREM